MRNHAAKTPSSVIVYFHTTIHSLLSQTDALLFAHVQVGLAVGLEARGGHNGYVHSGNRGDQNGVGMTMYAPNMNLVSLKRNIR